MSEPGSHVENPRQTPSWRYSTRYGPLPPSFSRATLIRFDERPHLLIGGTASVVGEDSRHPGDVDAQLNETLQNIASVVSAAAGHDIEPDAALTHLVDVRVYVTKAGLAERVMRTISPRFPRTRTIDVVVAQICRPELLVEIEGLAAL
jgi:enamine deaminase RidA (YjgF/YER057c/UK114 family)